MTIRKDKLDVRVSLVGAGIGDPDLITIKGVKALKKADAVLYDALVNPELLEYAPTDALKIFVGKRAGQHSLSQEEINELIVSTAFSEGHVVRLKGGDPFVFGRGHEEMQYVESFGIPVEIVPGVSSALAGPALNEIPLTRRGVSESFWVITATTKSRKLSQDLQLAAQSTATVVLLMGTRKLPEIAEVYRKLDKGDLPAAIIQYASLPEERVGLTTIEDLPALAEREKIGSPAVIIVGEVVGLHKQFPEKLVEIAKNYHRDK